MSFEFLIVGAGRGGTSLLTGLLDSHSGLEVQSEYASAKRLMDQSMNISERVQSFKNDCLAEAARYPSKRWGNKITTEQLQAIGSGSPLSPAEALDYFFKTAFPELKILFILRDGRSCVQSKVNRAGITYEQACERWNYSVDVMRYLIDHHPQHRVFKFEELLTSPKAILSEAADFIGVPFEERMLEGTDNPKLLPEYRNKGFVLDKLKVNECASWASAIHDNLSYCGYVVN